MEGNQGGNQEEVAEELTIEVCLLDCYPYKLIDAQLVFLFLQAPLAQEWYHPMSWDLSSVIN